MLAHHVEMFAGNVKHDEHSGHTQHVILENVSGMSE